MDELLAYIEQTKVTKEEIDSNIIHPIIGKKYPNRTIFVLLKKYANDFFKKGAEPRFIGIAGLRGVGKTTTMWQLTDELFKKNTQNIYFFNVNIITNLGFNLQQALDSFQKKVLKTKFTLYNEPIVLLFDEIHDDPSWAKTMKILYDEAKTAFIVCTGSSALLLQQTADLARRMKIEKLYPFKFTEFINAKSFYENGKYIFPQKGISSNLQQNFFFSENSNDLYNGLKSIENEVNDYYENIAKYNTAKYNIYNLIEEYIKYHNIPAYLVYKEKSSILDSVLSLFSRIIYEDIRKIEPDFKYLDELMKLLLRLAASDEINYEKLSNILGIPKNDIDKIIDILDKAEIINLLLPYGNIDRKITKNKKAFFMSPSLRLALLNSIFGKNIRNNYYSKLYEDITVLYLRKNVANSFLSFISAEDSKNPDFVVETGELPIIIEVGINKKRIDQIKNSSLKKFRYAFLISNSVVDIQYIENQDIILIPFKWFLLL